jgi:hypothetical protein
MHGATKKQKYTPCNLNLRVSDIIIVMKPYFVTIYTKICLCLLGSKVLCYSEGSCFINFQYLEPKCQYMSIQISDWMLQKIIILINVMAASELVRGRSLKLVYTGWD